MSKINKIKKEELDMIRNNTEIQASSLVVVGDNHIKRLGLKKKGFG